jgi:hypothetical protein
MIIGTDETGRDCQRTKDVKHSRFQEINPQNRGYDTTVPLPFSESGVPGRQSFRRLWLASIGRGDATFSAHRTYFYCKNSHLCGLKPCISNALRLTSGGIMTSFRRGGAIIGGNWDRTQFCGDDQVARQPLISAFVLFADEIRSWMPPPGLGEWRGLCTGIPETA